MKNLNTLLLVALLSTSVLAQAPRKMSYQAVVRNTDNELLSSRPVGMRISILQGSTSGVAVFVERHTVTTNMNGLVSLEIGNGTSLYGSFSTIDWSSGPYFIMTETDPLGGTDYSVTGISKFMSVPYALFAERSNTPGPQGANGASAYDIAVQNGFSGTEAQFIAGLRGADGANGQDGADGRDGASAYDIAVQNGFSGTEAQFITALRGADGANGQDGANGADGRDGASAYDIAVQNGFSGTEAQFITSLRGADGANGQDGTDGRDGASAYDIAVQNGFSGTEAQFITSLRGADGANGQDGADGRDGVSAYDIAVQNGFSGTEAQFIAGLQGAAGNDGANGKNSLVKSSVEPSGSNCSAGGVKLEYGMDSNDNGTLDLAEVDHALTRFVCNGDAGIQGPQGPQGPAGSYTAGNGISISNGTVSQQPVEYAYLNIGNAVQSSVQTLSPQWQVQTYGITMTNGTTFTLNADKLYEVTAIFQIYNVAMEQYTFMFYNVTSGYWMNGCPAYFGESGNDRSYRNETIKFMWKSSSPTSFDLRKFSNNTVNGNLIGSVMIKEIR